MTFLELRKRVAEMLGLDQTQTTQDDIIKAWVNDSYQFITGMQTWPWALETDIIQTSLEITTETVSVTNGSTAITFSSAPSVTVANDYRIQFEDSDDWYDISSHTAESTSATLSDPFLGATNAVSTYKLRKVYYDLPTDFGRMRAMKQSRTDVKLEPIDWHFKDKILPDPTDLNEPTFYDIRKQDFSISSSTQPNYQVTFFPTPNVEMNIDFTYNIRVGDLSTDTDIPIIPPQWHSILIFDTLDRYGYTFLDDTRKQEVKIIKAEILDTMIKNRRPMAEKLLKKLQWDKAIDVVRLNRVRIDLPIVEI